MNNIVIVPAKGDSSRFPRKNWMEFDGRTLFELSLIRASKSGLGEVVFVTDSDEMINKICQRWPLWSQVIKLPDSFTKKRALDSCLYALEHLMGEGYDYDNVIVTLPTSPFCTAEQMKEAYQRFLDNGRKTLASFTQVRGRPKLWQIIELNLSNNSLILKPEISQAVLVETYNSICLDNGAIYIDTVDAFLRRKEWFGDHVNGYFMDEISGIDIDTEMDYLVAKAMYESGKVKL